MPVGAGDEVGGNDKTQVDALSRLRIRVDGDTARSTSRRA
jgi:hypothetical protein